MDENKFKQIMMVIRNNFVDVASQISEVKDVQAETEYEKGYADGQVELYKSLIGFIDRTMIGPETFEGNGSHYIN